MMYKLIFLLNIVLTYVSANSNDCSETCALETCVASAEQIEGFNTINEIRVENGHPELPYSLSASSLSRCHIHSTVHGEHQCTDIQDQSLLWTSGVYCWTPCCPENADAACRNNKMQEMFDVEESFYAVTISRPLDGNVAAGIRNFYDLYPEKFEQLYGTGTIGVAVYLYLIEISITSMNVETDICENFVESTSTTTTTNTDISTTVSSSDRTVYNTIFNTICIASISIILSFIV